MGLAAVVPLMARVPGTGKHRLIKTEIPEMARAMEEVRGMVTAAVGATVIINRLDPLQV